MFTPDTYLYERNLALLASLSEEELADRELCLQLVAADMGLAAVGSWIIAVVIRGLAGLADAFAYAPDAAEAGSASWLSPYL